MKTERERTRETNSWLDYWWIIHYPKHPNPSTSGDDSLILLRNPFPVFPTNCPLNGINARCLLLGRLIVTNASSWWKIEARGKYFHFLWVCISYEVIDLNVKYISDGIFVYFSLMVLFLLLKEELYSVVIEHFKVFNKYIIY